MAIMAARDLLDRALKRRAELRLESEALDNLIYTYQRLLNLREQIAQERDDQLDLYRGASERSIRAARVAEMMDAARRIIIAEKRPMKRGELVTRLEEQGYEVIGGDKNKVFGTNLWRSGKFNMIEGQGYWPVDVEFPK